MKALSTVASDHVRESSSPEVNHKIDHQTRMNIHWYRDRSPMEINTRLKELEKEWNIERMLEVNAAAISLASLILSVTSSRKWLLLTGTVATFLAQHAIQGWCPPFTIFRGMGIRTQQEIDEERVALMELLERKPEFSA